MAFGQFSPAYIQQYITDFGKYCSQYTIDCLICNTIFGALFGLDFCQTNYVSSNLQFPINFTAIYLILIQTQLPGILAHLPDTTSIKTMSHVSQNIVSKTFCEYDYDFLGNLILSPTPQCYNWTAINVPVVIYYGLNDNIAVPAVSE